MPLIDHVVVAIMENRSFDNLLGWLYSDVDNCPPHTIPAEAGFQYDGLIANTYANSITGDEATQRYVKRSTSAWPPHQEPLLVPMPDPGESFAHITRQSDCNGRRAIRKGGTTAEQDNTSPGH